MNHYRSDVASNGLKLKPPDVIKFLRIYKHTRSRRLTRDFFFLREFESRARPSQSLCTDGAESTEKRVGVDTDGQRQTHDEVVARRGRSKKEGQYKQLARSCLRKRFQRFVL